MSSISPFEMPRPGRLAGAFSLVELLVTIVILSVLASMVVTAVSNASVDSSRVVARQQQAALQQALGAWVVSESSKPGASLAAVRTQITGGANNLARLNLFSDYLDPETLSEFTSNTTNANRLETKALNRSGQYLFIAVSSGYPMVGITNVDE